jgi:hypothetical protein
MSAPINLAAHRAARSGDCRDWSPLDALRECIEKIESGEWDVEMVYVAMKTRADRDGNFRTPSRCAGMNRLESIGLLSDHLHDTMTGGRR